jgi:hypothetical protein
LPVSVEFQKLREHERALYREREKACSRCKDRETFVAIRQAYSRELAALWDRL